MRKKVNIFFILGLFLSLVGCSAYIDTRREAGQMAPVGQSRPGHLALCYNPMFGDDAQMEGLANGACFPKKAVRIDDETKYFNCTLFYPNTAFYKCE